MKYKNIDSVMRIKIVAVLACMLYQQSIFGYVPIQVQSFKKAIRSNTQVANCANCDFRGVQDLAGVDAHGAYMPGVTFQPCLPNVQNKNSIMVCTANQMANLTGINLAHVNLYSSCLDWAILKNAILTGADLTNSSVQYAHLENAKVNGIITTNATFCNSVMPDGTICTDSWTGQGVTIQCNCAKQDADADLQPSTSQITSSKKSTISTSQNINSKVAPIPQSPALIQESQ
ncbi:MAG: pentapeptide repeat-containing protein [Candidatus Dependentiae bacterium]|nr:pentapeptide repeat-containing protein [Candidatus Dependentiae bacterium]